MVLGIFFTLVLNFSSHAQESKSSSKPATQSAPAWRVQKAKNFPNWKVEILSKQNPQKPLGIESSKAIIKDLNGNIKAEIQDVIIEPDPKENISGWVPGTLLDLDKDGLEDLVLKNFSGGAHCCFTYQIYSLGKVLKKLGELKLMDCGENIKLQDLNGDGLWEILTCNAKFTYLKNLPYSQSPFPPQVFGLINGKYVNIDKQNIKIFDEDIAEQKRNLVESYSDSTVIQIVLNYLLSGRESQAWQEFEQLYTSANKEMRKQELIDRWQQYLGLKAESKVSESQNNPNPGWKLP